MDLNHAHIMIFLPKLMLVSQNRFLEGWGGAPQVWAGKKLFSTNQFKFTQKKILTRRTPFLPRSTSRKCRFWQFSEKKNLNFEIVAEILVRNFCRNFWQHDGDPLTQKCPVTRFYEILCIFRKDTTF